jgi:flagellar basal body P-ring formation protein FlgA
MLCPNRPSLVLPTPAARGRWARALWHGCCAAVGWLAIAALVHATTAPIEADVRAWVAERQGVAAATVSVQVLDPRIGQRRCPGGWLIDQPFPQPETLRVRCPDIAWQGFVRATWEVAPTAPRTVATRAPAVATEAATRTVVVSTAWLPRGLRLSAEHLTLTDVSAQGLPSNALERIDDALQGELIRDIPAGLPLRSSDLRPAWLVRKGQTVVLSWQPTPGFSLTARLEALEDGRLGDTVRLRNRESGRVVTAQVTGPNTAAGI